MDPSDSKLLSSMSFPVNLCERKQTFLSPRIPDCFYLAANCMKMNQRRIYDSIIKILEFLSCFFIGNGSNSPAQNSTRSVSPNIATNNNNNSNGHIQPISQPTQLQSATQQQSHHLLNNSVNLGTTPTLNHTQQVDLRDRENVMTELKTCECPLFVIFPEFHNEF